MATGRPVIAVNNGGPRESVVHGATGWLCEPTAEAFADAFAQAAIVSISRVSIEASPRYSRRLARAGVRSSY